MAEGGPGDLYGGDMRRWLGPAGERACSTLTIAVLVAVISVDSRSTIWQLRRRADGECCGAARLVIPATVGRFRVFRRGLKWYVGRGLGYMTITFDAHGVDGRARQRDDNTI